MTTEEKDRLTMYQTVIRFLAGPGAALAAIKLIGLKRDELAAVVAEIERLTGQQGQTTTGVTSARETLKTSVVDGADALRLLVRALTTDDQLRGQLQPTVARKLKGDDSLYVAYLKLITTSIGGLDKDLLEDAGYDAAVLTPVMAALAKLDTTTGATRDIRIDTTAATVGLDVYFKQATQVLDADHGLDALVHAQKANPARVELVTKYDEAREIIGTVAPRRRPTYKGPTRYGSPLLVFDRQTTAAPSLTLGNRSGRGISLLYYTAATPDGKPDAGKGQVVKNRETHHLTSYDTLGGPDARYLLVQQRELAGEGQFYVQA